MTTSGGFSVRARITATVAVLVLLAMTLTGLVIYTLESARIEDAAATQADQEIAEFSALAHEGVDPRTNRGFTGVDALLTLFLERNVPAENERLIAWYDGRPQKQSRGKYADLWRDPELEQAVRGLRQEGGQTRLNVDEAGELLVTVQPVELARDGEQGALVVVTFLDEERETLVELMRTYVIVALLSFGAITGLAAWQAGRLLRPVRRLASVAREISASDLSRRIPETGNDDITDLTRTVNRMLARLEGAFGDQRQFLDAAGHELKTPLTVLRGHLELLETGNPAEVAETRALLLDEVDRMSRLVGDLILLAKSDRPDFVVAEPVDLPPFVDTLLAKARGLGERRWGTDAVADGVLPLDAQRLTQALLQLADNAVKHTGPGDEIAFGCTLDAHGARFHVRDTGAGVAAADRERIFERFGRSHVTPGDEGFGLGLSIVQAIAHAHGGHAWVEDSPGGGALFLIDLPLSATAAQEETAWPTS